MHRAEKSALLFINWRKICVTQESANLNRSGGGCNLKISQKEFENRYNYSPCVVGDFDSDSDEIRRAKNDYEENN